MKLLVALSTLIAFCWCLDYPEWVKSVDQLETLMKASHNRYELEDEDLPQIPSYVGIGYDALKGNPLTNKIDPGFRNAVFDFSTNDIEMTEDKLYLIPIGMKSHIRRACSFSAKTSEVANTQDYQSNLGVYANIAGSFGSLFSFSASVDYKEFESGSKNANLISTITSAQCEMYSLEMPVFTDFSLSSDFVNGALDAYNGTTSWRRFIAYFGTHFVSSCVLGGRMHLQTKFERSAYQSLRENNINVQMAAQASFLSISGSGSLEMNKYQNDRNAYETASDSKTSIYIGGTPPADGDWTEWEKAVKQELAPISYKLNFIGDLFTTDYFTDVAEEDLAKMKTQYQKAIDAHCVDNGCSAPGILNYGPLAIFRSEYWPKYISGNYFEYMRADNSDMTIRKINMKHGSWLDNIQVIIKSSKKTYTSNKYGSQVQATSTFEVPFGEYINKIEITYDDTKVTSMIFTTNDGTQSQRFGLASPNYMVIELNGKLVGIYGYATTDRIISIGFISSEQVYDTSYLGVVLYDGSANDGTPMALTRGAAINDLNAYLFSDRLSSLQAYSLVKVCSAINFGGTCDYYSQGTYSQKRVRMSNQISSVRSIDHSEVGAIVYLDRNYRGDSFYILKDEMFTDLSIRGWEKRISSIKIFAWLKVCTEVNFGGTCRYFNPTSGNRSYIGDFLDEQIQSITAYDTESIVGSFFVDANYKGARFVMRLGESLPDLSLNGFDKTLSSFKVTGGADVLMCTEKDFKGYCVYVTTGSQPVMTSGLNKRVSSIMFGNNRDRFVLLSNYWTIKNGFTDIVGSADLTPVGTATLVRDRYDVEDSAIRVRAVDKYFTAPSGVYITGEFTISAWVKPLDLSSSGRIRVLCLGNGVRNDVINFEVAMLRLTLTVARGTNLIIDEIFPTTIPANQWSLIAVTLSATKLRFFFNGDLVTEKENTDLPQAVTRTLNYIGKSSYENYGEDLAVGDVDEVKLYNVALGINDILMEFKESKKNYLTHHWTISSNDWRDLIGVSGLTEVSSGVQVTPDRFGNINVALRLFKAHIMLRGGYYFEPKGFTLSAWVKPINIYQCGGRIMDFASPTKANNVVFSISDGYSMKPYFYIMINDEIKSLIVFDKALDLNEWSYVAVSVSITRISAYIDGVLINEVANYNLPENVDYTSFYIGKPNIFGADPLFADISDVKMYGQSLSATDVYIEYKESMNTLRNHWPLDGNFIDYIGTATMVSSYNNVWAVNRFSSDGGAVQFTDGFLGLPPSIYFDSDFTISMWVKPMTTNGAVYAYLFTCGNGPASDTITLFMSNNQVALRPYFVYYSETTKVNELTFSQEIFPEQWAHLTVTVGSTINAYLNGVVINFVNNNGKALPNRIQRTQCFIGTSPAGYPGLKATVDEFRIYNVALSPAEVFALYRKK